LCLCGFGVCVVGLGFLSFCGFVVWGFVVGLGF